MNRSSMFRFLLAVSACAFSACGSSVTLVPVSSIKAEPTKNFPRTWDETPLPQEPEPETKQPTPGQQEAAQGDAEDAFARPTQSNGGPVAAKKTTLLFNEGKDLAAHGKPAEACSKLEESERLDPGDGTRFHLANCYEQMGKTASAWSLFVKVADASKEAKKPDREKLARDRASSLEPKLSRLTITVSRQPTVPGFDVRRNRIAVPPAQWGVPVPVDPGTYIISATAPGVTYWYAIKEVPWGGGVVNVVVPVLVDPSGADAPARP